MKTTVEKIGGGYGGPVTVLARFHMSDGSERFVVGFKPEGGYGECAHIFSRAQLAGLDDAALASQPTASRGDGVPDGWKLVPVEPTEAMIDAVTESFSGEGAGPDHDYDDDVRRAYKALLASAPPAPTPEAEEGAIAAKQIVLGEGLVDITRIEHEGRVGVLFRPRAQHIPFGDGGELQPGNYWPTADDVVLWVSGQGPQVAIDALAALAPPPAPTPEAGSDLADQYYPQTIWYKEADAVEFVLNDCAHIYRELDNGAALVLDMDTRTVVGFRISSPAAWLNTVAPSPSLPPAEDLAGQGEPVTAESECLRIQHEAQEAVDRFNAKGMGAEALTSQGVAVGASRCARAVSALAPAPSRPADREEIAAELNALAARAHDAALLAFTSEARFGHLGRKTALLEAAALALRDPPRDGGDGWRPNFDYDNKSTWPPQGHVLAHLFHNARLWGDWQVDYFERVVHFFYGDIPSPNAGDGTQDRQGGGR